MRPIALLAALLPLAACADREIRVPLGRKLLEGQTRMEWLGQSGRGESRAWVGVAFLQSFDAEFGLFRPEGGEWRGTLDFSYNFSPPITDIAPGISFGMVDLANVAPGGRAAYAAMTYRYGNDRPENQDTSTEFTLGFWTRESGLLFFATSLPVTNRFLLIAEHDGERLAAGLELRPVPFARLKVVFESRATELGASVSVRL